MALSAAVRPLVGAATLRAGVFLVVGGVLAAAYGLLVGGYVQMYRDPTLARGVVTALVIVTAAIVVLPPVLHPVRVLEATAARTLLDVDLEPDPGSGPGATARGAVWFVLHLLTGALAALLLLVAVPLSVSLVARQLGARRLEDQLGVLADLPAALAVVLALVLLLVPPYAMWALRALLRAAAPRLLGPSAQVRIARLEAEARELAARNALARDLHDSVGHALTVTTLPAAAAERALDRDPELARAALTAIAETGRDAVAELDRVLGVLRSDASAPDAAGPGRTLADAAALAAEARGTGRPVDLTLPADVDAVPSAVSRAAYAILREAVTNALRHGDGDVTAEVAVAGGVEVSVRNVVRPGSAPGRGRGVAGMHERAAALGGTVTAGPHGRHWVLRASLPVEGP